MTVTAHAPASVIPRIETALDSFLTERFETLRTLSTDVEPVLRAARQIVLGGGKRLRPQFAYLGWQAAARADDDDQPIVTAAGGLELLHACALVHDDVIDRSAMRRGRPTAHAAFEALHAQAGFAGSRGDFGRGVAIILGDLLFTWADHMIATAGLPPSALPRARAVYDRMRETLVAGQYLDLLLQARGRSQAVDTLRVVEYKTSAYTVEGPLLFGAAAADASRELTAALSAYGRRVGEAFQLRDDVLGAFGDPQRTGKPASDDLHDGKQTLLVAISAERADSVQAAVLHRHLGNPSLDRAGMDELRQLFVDTGALAEVELRISTSIALACATLRDATMQPSAREALDELALAAAHRQT
jgi:geranylgeranyl diphosphate synthase, type I